ncbi:hypothetical protein I7I50_01717 [Histoplasma capsulatum G186AR]|uniref:Uncharacterized protein n=1 Tax=Ajellomyces capsulatus TaxID=5037 RepID=A0A8H8CRX3_AJECA|nr:hypothetical protein I7I52_11931 [Histoplasma capsulatum]QSS71012.1 hypothetical protein I7I50_01717 [Histoplasma capsulatum G186AR]
MDKTSEARRSSAPLFAGNLSSWRKLYRKGGILSAPLSLCGNFDNRLTKDTWRKRGVDMEV